MLASRDCIRPLVYKHQFCGHQLALAGAGVWEGREKGGLGGIHEQGRMCGSPLILHLRPDPNFSPRQPSL